MPTNKAGRAMIDWDDAFDNSGYVPGSKLLPEKWAAAALQMRKTASLQADVPYGTDARDVFDLFSPNGAARGTVVFVHGGYWHMLDKSYWSHLARGWIENGWAVAIPSYRLAPQARISEITSAISEVVQQIASMNDGPLVLVGHSAGGHLVSRMLCNGVLPMPVLARIKRVVAVSGVFHLEPLLGTRMNETLRLTQAEAKRESPALLEPVPDVPVTFWVGDHERPEFLRQTRLVAERWAAKSVKVETVYAPGRHHFDVLDGLTDALGDMTLHAIA